MEGVLRGKVGTPSRAQDHVVLPDLSPPSSSSLDPTSIMASIQRYVITLLLMLTFTFVYFAQTGEAAKGPKITNKVSFEGSVRVLCLTLLNRSTLTSPTETSRLVASSWVYTARLCPRYIYATTHRCVISN